MLLDVLDIKGKTTGRKIELLDEVFNISPNDHVLYLAVNSYLAAQRQGTHAVKNRKEVKGSSKKLHKQKGTGGSRKGNIRNPLYKGGGTIFGPTPRSYHIKLNKKVKTLARLSALTYKAKENAILIIENFDMPKPKTKEFIEILNNLQINDKKILLLTDTLYENIYLSLRNLQTVSSVLYSDFSTYSVLNADILLMTEKAARLLNEPEEETTIQEKEKSSQLA